MYRSQKEISLDTETQISLKSLPQSQTLLVPESSRTQQLIRPSSVQTPKDRAQVIRSNKNILKKNLRNSLQIPKTSSITTSKEENLTASSLKDLESEEYMAFKKGNLKTSDSGSASIKLFLSQTEKIIQEAFDEKYQILKKIGQGAHSIVYKTLCKFDNKMYALKKIKNMSFENQKKTKNLFRMLKLINHQSIIKYQDFHFDEQKRTAFVFMEYSQFADLRSEMLKRSVAGNSFTQNEILNIANQIASVLEYLHSQGICHRDLKPQNILYCKQSGKVKVIDLDVCGVKNFKNTNFDLWTNTGTLMYRAPQTFGVGYTEKTDIWSLGTIIYELVTGKVPFQTQYEKDFVEKIKTQNVKLTDIQTSSKVKSLLKRCLEKDPSRRISAQDILGQLSWVIQDDSKMERIKISNMRRSFEDSDSNMVCLGNILKFSYY